MEHLEQDGLYDPYDLTRQVSSPDWIEWESWWIELVGGELRPLNKEGECVICHRLGQLYADVECVWPVCLRCRLEQPATDPGDPWRFKVVAR